jgi:hypothetical protein
MLMPLGEIWASTVGEMVMIVFCDVIILTCI